MERKKRVVPGDCAVRPKGVTTVQSSAERTEVSRGHSSRKVKDRISRSLEYDWKGGMTDYDRKHKQWLFAKR